MGLFTIFASAQTPKYKASVCHTDGTKESVYTNVIDSITFSDTASGFYEQNIWVNGVAYSSAVENIDSVSLKGSIIEYTILEEAIEDIVGGIVTSDGTYCLLQRNDSTEGYACYIGENESGELPMIVEMDTLGIIRSIFCNETIYDFVFHENTFDIIVTSDNETNTIANISYDIFNQNQKSRAQRRAVSISNEIDGWAEMANKINAVASIGQIASNPKALSSKIGILTMLGGMSDNKYVRRSAIAVDLVMSLKNGGVLGLVSGLFQAGREVLTEYWFGDVKLTTIGAEHITDTKYRVRCSVTNLSNIPFPGMFTKLTMTLKQNSIISSITGEMEQDSKYITNDNVYDFVFDGLELGKQYSFQPRLYRTWFENHSAAENMSVGSILSNPGAVGVVSVERQSECYMYGEIGTFATNSSETESIETKKTEATRGHVNFTIEVKGKGYAAPNNDKETLGQGSLGVYIKNGDEYKHYPATSINGNNFTAELSFEESIYTMDNADYSTFISTKKIEIGSYVMAYRQSDQYDYENVYYYSEPQEYELVYDEKPRAITGDKISEEQTSAVVKCKYEDYVFWDAICGIEYVHDGSMPQYKINSPADENAISITLTGLTPNTTYQYRAYFEVKGKKEYGEYKSFKTKGNNLCPDENHPHMIDLGLSVKWSCCNVGAPNPEGNGGYYSWGETSEKSDYSSTSYTLWNDLNGNGTWDVGKDNCETIDIGKDIAGSSYDVATVLMGSQWRMPTKEQCEELKNNCKSYMTTVNGKYGRIFIGEKGRIFLPAAGLKETGYDNEMGFYWTSTMGEDSGWGNTYNSIACEFYFGYGGVFISDNSAFRNIYNGLTVRAIAK